jgi:hypothetical protein
MLALALVLLLAAAAYFVVTTLVDLYPFNNVRDARRSEKAAEVLVNAPLMTLPAVLLGLAAAISLPALGYAAAAVELIIGLGGLALWWLPYLAGVAVPWATAGTGASWPDLHARTYAHTVIVLPHIGDRPRPNLEHLILHALILAAAACSFAAATAL